ncbi:amino acid hydroxylase [Aldersonia kunmingensis]|uniref:amino acid hydroxylase n=1 Tax=Aldersonia kunmingensis TaxID=408066 RepID=UPI000B1FDE62|nr:amino acid hydroxylase [Aldersonia kunmingensis]
MTVHLDARAERERTAREFRPGQPLPNFSYSGDEDALWSDVFATLRGMHERRSCTQYRLAAQRVGLPAGRVPQLSEVSFQLRNLTGFELAPVMGSLPGRLFYPPLAHGILRSTPALRPVSEQLFSPDPDVIHELVGHAVMLADPEFAQMYRWFGRATKRAESDEAMAAIARVFWYTMEVGAVIDDGRPRACGAAILSSVSEMESFVDAELRPFRIEDVVATDIDDSVCQPAIFAPIRSPR